MQDVMSGVYKHYKGKFYLVLGVARHSETEEKYVVYVHLYTKKGTVMWIRPYTMFFEDVVVHGKKQKRFEYIGSEMPEDLVEKA